MTSEEFVRVVKLVVEDSAAQGVKSLLANPPGRKPAEGLLSLSSWYTRLSDVDRAKADEVIAMAADLATYNFLLMLDGLTRVDEGEPVGRLRLYYERFGETDHLNSAMDLNDGEFLSSILKSLDPM